MPKELIRVLSRITLITQLGLSLVLPPVLLALGAMWLQKRFGVGDWLLVCAILTGVLSGACSAYQLLRAELSREERQNRAYTERGDTQDETRPRR